MGNRQSTLSVGRMALCALILMAAACSRQQSDWEKSRTANNIESYEQFLKKYPNGEFTAQAQARVKELSEERDWQKARDADTPEAYQAFLKQYPEGKWAEEARIRVENFSLAQTPASAANAGAGSAGAASATATPAGESKAAAAAPAPAGAVPAPDKSKPAPADSSPSEPAQHAGSSKFAVQVGAFTSNAAAAEQAWTKLQQRFSSVLSGVKHRVAVRSTSKGKLFRLQGIELTEAKARAICASLKAKSQTCFLVAPEKHAAPAKRTKTRSKR